MGTLQPGLPSPVMILQDWQLLIIDLMDCVFNIPLYPQDAERFAFTIISDFFHQSAQMLARQFHISHSDAQGIVKSCPTC
ncbi:POK25 protein, partial [Ramphastos sulfuratus]|nr:POK25 protein [Ramphastos sulfuratus]NXP83071.1 POK25 protein [Ramphastos sulfuratus]